MDSAETGMCFPNNHGYLHGITSGQMKVILKTEAIIVRGLFCDHMITHLHAGICTPVHLPQNLPV
jgi:hypothetical protein